VIAGASILSLTAIARLAERHVRARGAVDVDELLELLTLAAGGTSVAARDRAEAGLRLAVIGERLRLDRAATIAMPL
jgi:hypothetical protein